MKKIIFTSQDVLEKVQNVFPENLLLFEPNLKGKLVIMETPCEKNIPFTWAFPIKDNGVTDYAIYEHIYDRVYNYVGEPKGKKIAIGEKFENSKIILEAIEKDGEIAVEMTIKTRAIRELDAIASWEKYRRNCKKPFLGHIYDDPVPVYYKNLPVWLIGVKTSDQVKKLRDILYVEEGEIQLEKDVIFEHEIVLALPDDENFFSK